VRHWLSLPHIENSTLPAVLAARQSAVLAARPWHWDYLLFLGRGEPKTWHENAPADKL